MKYAQIWTVALLLVASATLVWLRGDTDHVPPSTPLAQLPTQLAGWTGQDIPIPQETLDILGKGSFLNRVYERDSGKGVAPVGLFIGYFPTQRSGQSIHSPQNCLPGGGWSFESSGTTEVIPGDKQYQVGEYLISNGAVESGSSLLVS